jgi:hypothetical protein
VMADMITDASIFAALVVWAVAVLWWTRTP